MMRWDFKTLRAVRGSGAYAEGKADAAIPQDALSGVLCARAVRELIDGAHQYGVDLEERDIDVNVMTDSHEATDVQIVRAFAVWHPKVDEVELVGGAQDGAVWAVPNIDHDLRIPVYAHPQIIEPNDSDEIPEASIRVVTYRLCGWDAENRRWLMNAV